MVSHPNALPIVKAVKSSMSPSDMAWDYLSAFRFHQRKSDEPVAVIKDMQLLQDTINDVLLMVVEEMRTDGASWSEVGQALGITRQGARQRYGGAGIK